MGVGTMDRLQELRTAWGFPMHVNSGYRCPKHPVEAGKARLGAHVYGHAADIAMPDPAQKYAFIALAMEHGFTGIGVAAHYVHLDDVAPGEIARIVRPARWTYPA